MSKSKKLPNGNYWDSKSIAHNNKSLDNYLTPKEISITYASCVKNGAIRCARYGCVVQVEVSDLTLTENKIEWNTLVATGLPSPILYGENSWVKGKLVSSGVILTSGGNLYISERSGTQSASSTYIGQLIYLTNDAL